MPFLTNNSQALRIVHGKKQYDIPPKRSIEVDDETDWKANPLVKAKLLVLDMPSGDDLDLDDDDNNGIGEGSGNGGGSADGETMEGLQAEYKEVTGKTADNRWSMETLKEKIEEALDA